MTESSIRAEQIEEICGERYNPVPAVGFRPKYPAELVKSIHETWLLMPLEHMIKYVKGQETQSHTDHKAVKRILANVRTTETDSELWSIVDKRYPSETFIGGVPGVAAHHKFYEWHSKKCEESDKLYLHLANFLSIDPQQIYPFGRTLYGQGPGKIRPIRFVLEGLIVKVLDGETSECIHEGSVRETLRDSSKYFVRGL